MIEPVIRATLSTVAVTSRTLKILRSAGASSAVGPLIAPPVSITERWNLSGVGEPSKPGTLASMSISPPQ